MFCQIYCTTELDKLMKQIQLLYDIPLNYYYHYYYIFVNVQQSYVWDFFLLKND